VKDPELALEYVERCYRLRAEYGNEEAETGESPETEGQRELVREFYQERE